MPEEWRPVKGFEELFLVSNTGRVKALGRYRSNHGTPVWADEHFVRPYVTNIGYMQYNLHYQGKSFKRYAHRLVAEAFVPNPEHKPEVDHVDNDKLNNCAANLRWVTHAENMRKMFDARAEKRGYVITKRSKKLQQGSAYNLCSCGAKKEARAQMCITCRKAARRRNIPSKEELIICAQECDCVLLQVGRRYGVSDNAVRKWLRGYGLPAKSCQLWEYIATLQAA